MTLDKRIRIEVPIVTGKSATNEDIVSWLKYCDVWCEIKPALGGETQSGDEQIAVRNVNIRMRTHRGINPTMRIKYLDREFEISSVADDLEDRRFMTILAKERQ